MQTTLDSWERVKTASAETEGKNTQNTLEILCEEVLAWMAGKRFFTNREIDTLKNISLGFLRRNSTQKHGVCRFQKGTNIDSPELGPRDVRCIDLHPALLDERWWDYAHKVLYHEFLHALGYFSHNDEFNRLEGAWDDRGADLGHNFTEVMRRANAAWIWRCEGCASEFPRRKRSAGKYRCRRCDMVLTDIRIQR